MTNFLRLKSLSFLVIFLCFSIGIQNVHAQCAGLDKSVTICEKDADPANKTFDLFLQLDGTPTAGGIWSANSPINRSALDEATGKLNLWAILINNTPHSFTYTNDCGSGPETAIVTVILGGYPGEDNIDGSANACGDNDSVNMFTYIGSNIPGKVQDSNGLWEEVVPAGFLTENLFDAQAAGVGIYEFTYTTPIVGSCTSRTSRVILEVHPPPNPGIPRDYVVCVNDDLSGDTNLDLNSYLTDEDNDGIWSEDSTSELSGPLDINIDVQNIRDTFGYGSYPFTYTVFPSNPTCKKLTSVVSIVILPAFEATITAISVCQGSEYKVDIVYNKTIFPGGIFDITYETNGTSGIREGKAEKVDLSDGSGSFNLDPTKVDLNQPVNITITKLEVPEGDPDFDFCEILNKGIPITTTIIVGTPNANNTICNAKNSSITLDTILNPLGALANDTYTINYELTAPDSSITNLIANAITFTNGDGAFEIPASSLTQLGDYSLKIIVTGSIDLKNITDTTIEDCPITTSFTILPTFEATIATSNYCQGTPYSLEITYNNAIFPNGAFDFTYETTSSLGIQAGTATNVNLVDGVATFLIDPAIAPINEEIGLTLTTIKDSNTTSPIAICGSINDGSALPSDTFFVTNPIANSIDICPDMDAIVNITNILDTSGSLTNDTYTINYTLIDPDSNRQDLVANAITFSNGAGSYTIPAATFTKTGIHNLEITVTGSLDLDCAIKTAFNINPIPPKIALGIVIDNSCDATDIKVIINAPVLTDGKYDINYVVTKKGTSTPLINNAISFTGGSANYQVGITTLEDGEYTVKLNSFQNDTTPCRLDFDFKLEKNFSIGGIPNIPVVAADQTFCTATSTPTIADINITATGPVLWYANTTDTTALPTTTPLVHNTDYYVINADSGDPCISPDRLKVNITLLNPGMVTSSEIAPEFCSSENATIADLTATSPNGGSIIWYDAAVNGNEIPISTSLENGKSYYATERANEGCESPNRLVFTPIINTPAVAIIENTHFDLCRIDTPTLQLLQNEITDFSGTEVKWYAVETGGTPLQLSDALEENSTYYLESFDPLTFCTLSARKVITVNLNNCEPENYDYFIPDGFSPNGDGRNDTYFIPNIEKIYPEFTLEIYNRYGAILFKGNKNNLHWDGSTSNGNNTAPNGIYFYVIKYNRDGFSPTQGRLYLNR